MHAKIAHQNKQDKFDFSTTPVGTGALPIMALAVTRRILDRNGICHNGLVYGADPAILIDVLMDLVGTDRKRFATPRAKVCIAQYLADVQRIIVLNPKSKEHHILSVRGLDAQTTSGMSVEMWAKIRAYAKSQYLSLASPQCRASAAGKFRDRMEAGFRSTDSVSVPAPGERLLVIDDLHRLLK